MTLIKENFWDYFISAICFGLCNMFPSKTRTIPCPEDPDKPLLTQFVLIPEKLYLQHFHNPNEKKVFHNHRWFNMKSFILTSSFIEERMDEKPSYFLRKRFGKYKMTSFTNHRIESWGRNCWTVFYMGEVVNPDWGYYKSDENGNDIFIPWHEYISDDVKIPHIETGKITKHPSKENNEKLSS